MKNKLVKKLIREKTKNIRAELDGRYEIEYALELLVKNFNEYKDKIQTVLYPKLAESFGKKEKSVERTIRYAIKKTYGENAKAKNVLVTLSLEILEELGEI